MKQRLSQLDLLRGIALIGVIVVHARYAFPSFSYWAGEAYVFGRYGVQLFFAVSGFTIMMMYQSYLTKWESPVRVFYLKRIMRLYPLFFVAAFLYIPFTEDYLHFNPDGLQAMDIVRVLTLTSGVDPHLLNAVVPGGWSIIDEIYFYLMFPLMYLAYGRVNMWVIGVFIAGLNILLGMNAEAIFADREPYLIKDFLYRNILNNIVVFYAGIEAWRHLNNGKSDFLKIWIPFALAALFMQYHWSGMTGVAALKDMAIQTMNHQAPMIISAGLSILIYWLVIAAFKFENLTQPHIQKFGTVTYTGYIAHFGIIAIMERIVAAAGLEKFARFEIMILPLIAITWIVSFSLVKWTEQYWQNLANGLCDKFFARKNAQATPPTEPSSEPATAAG